MGAVASGDIITAPQTLTAIWVDLGGEIEVLDHSFFVIIANIDINDSENVQFRIRALEESEGDEAISPLMTIKKDKVLLDDVYYEVNDDSDQIMRIPINLDELVKIIKVQVKAKTVGATAGIITTATYRQGHRQ